MGGPSAIKGRDVMDGLCVLNKPEFAQHQKCHAGGNPCWERVVQVETTPAVEQAPPLAIEQALDDLDVRWRLAFNRHVVRLPGAEDVSVLALACGSRDEFERRLTSLADTLKRLDIPDDLLPDESELPVRSSTLDRVELLFRGRRSEDDLPALLSATMTLRRINQLRAGGQHSGEAQSRRRQASEALGVRLDGRWGEAWDRVRSLAASALRDIGTATRRVADAG
jgi:hypothetical protein